MPKCHQSQPQPWQHTTVKYLSSIWFIKYHQFSSVYATSFIQCCWSTVDTLHPSASFANMQKSHLHSYSEMHFEKWIIFHRQTESTYWCELTIAESPVTQFSSQMVCHLITITIAKIHVCIIFMCKKGHNFAYAMTAYVCRDHFVYAHSQWEMMLQCNIISHWLGTCTKWSLCLVSWHVQNCDLLL